ncbi:RND family transporter [uncultured Clostridium sp.]|uniref:efflux RND transporter permease subunit n=1 Tax=uncultured Clostridium sp. TaxID=59620 RepID=UPI0025DB472C|nr:MMPL family transporter [uncultured Clostridium sp.]
MKEKNNFLINLIINKRKIIEKIFIILVIISTILFPFVKVNYDLTEYLPETAKSKIGINILEDEFGYPGTARIMIENVSIYEAKLLKDKIENVNGVDMVLWADSITDIYQGNNFIDYKNIKDYYYDKCAVMDVTFDEGDSSSLTSKAIDEIKKITGDKGYFCGPAVESKSLNETLSREIAIAMVMAVVLIAIILCLTTTSWFEPFLFLMVMGIAIIINMGTNIIFGTISFLTFSIAAILQLAVAMDYSIFLLHSFTREKEKGQTSIEAIGNAIKLSTLSILSSGATTIVGFLALTLMKFSIGMDMGLVLAKGIVISIITVLVLMPSLILRFADKIEKTSHKLFIPPFRKFAEGIYKLRVAIIVSILIISIPAYVSQNMNSFMYGNESLGASEGTKVYSDSQEINKHFGRSNLLIVLIPNTSNVREKELAKKLDDLYYVKSVTSLAEKLPEGIPERIIPKKTTSQLHTEKYARILLYTKTKGESDMAFKAADEITGIVKEYYPDDYHVLGVTTSTQDIKEIITKDYNYVNGISLLGVVIVILFAFKSGIIPVIVIIPIEIAIFINMGIPYVNGEKLIYMGYIIVSSLQLGATIDYSILLTNNYLGLRKDSDAKESAVSATSNSALSIVTSGFILTTVGYGLYFVSSVGAIADIGRLVGRGALLSMALVLGVLPILLRITDKIIVRKKKFNIKKIKSKLLENKKKPKTEENEKEKDKSICENKKQINNKNKTAIKRGDGNVKKE